MTNETIINSYAIQSSDTFESRFSKTSIENILFYVTALCVYTLEILFDVFKIEVDTRIENIVPHRTRWYAYKSLNFMKTMILKPDSDEYDTSGMDDGAIAAAANIATAISALNAIKISIVATLPEVGSAQTNTIYFVPNSSGSGDSYDEYMLIDGAFEKVGNTAVDLSGYLLEDDLVEITEDEIDAL
jgi:hypothetical protein